MAAVADMASMLSFHAVESLLLWRDVKRSGIVFGGATAVYLFILLNPLPWFTLICYGKFDCVDDSICMRLA